VLQEARRVVLPLQSCAERVQAKPPFYFNSCYDCITISEYVNDAKYFNVRFSTNSISGENVYTDTLNVLLFPWYFQFTVKFCNSSI